MILGLGTDIVRVSRILHIQQEYSGRFQNKILTPKEIAKLSSSKQNSAKYLAKRFAAKEALVKAIGVGFNDVISFQDISVLNDTLGKPYYELSENLDKYILQIFKTQRYIVHLSISDDSDYACAVSIIENN